MRERKLIVGIDPDCAKSGVAVLNSISKNLELANLTFFQLFDYLQFDKDSIKLVVIEAGWLNQATWSWQKRNNGAGQPFALKIGRNVGANQETGKKILEMCEYLELKTELVRPTTSKIGAKEFQRITGVIGRTNEEKRDAAMLILGRK